jgi:hypothetical protein
MTQTINLICFNCIHFRKFSGGCDAFPESIPDEILQTNKHDKPLQKQKNKIVYEKGEPKSE